MRNAPALFLISRTHGLKAHLLKSQDYLRLLGTSDLKGIVDYLLTTDYSSELSRIPTEGLMASQLEQVFYKKLSERWHFLLGITSGNMRELLEAHNARLEVENLKRIVRAVHGEEKASDAQLISIPRKYQNMNFSALLRTKKMTEVADLLKETPYKGLGELLVEYERYNSLIVLETQLDKVYYSDFWLKTAKSSDRKRIRALIGTEIDLRNLQLMISAKYMKLDPQLIERMIIDLRYKLRKNATTRLANVDLQEIPNVPLWTPYSQLLHTAVELVDEGRLVDMETLFSRYLYSYAEKMSAKCPTNLAYVFSYLTLCLREAKNLTTLVIGKQTKIRTENLRKLVLF